MARWQGAVNGLTGHATGEKNIALVDVHPRAMDQVSSTTPTLTGEDGRTLVPLLGGLIAENPTISIAPIDDEEFTKRLLTPFQESRLTLLLRQGVDIDLLRQLMAQELRLSFERVWTIPTESVTREGVRCVGTRLPHRLRCHPARL